MILVTFHGGGDPSTTNIDNIYGYDETTIDPTTSQPTAYPNVLSTYGTSFTLSELRGIVREQGILYVANGGKGVSNILGFIEVTGGKVPSFDNPALFVDSSSTINHPFGFTFADSATPNVWSWWVSNQDSNVVALLTAPAPTLTVPFSPANALSSGPAGTFLTTLLANLKRQKGSFSFLRGSFVASASVEPPLPQLTAVDSTWGGLDATVGDATSDAADKAKKKQKVLKSVRGVLFDKGIVYVADEVGKFVRMYDPNTGILWGSAVANAPVHLVVNDKTLYVSTSDGVYFGACPSPPTKDVPSLPDPFKKNEEPVPPYPKDPPKGYNTSVTMKLADLGLSPAPKTPSGMAFDSNGNLYVADRTEKKIYMYVPNPKKGDSPPFVTPSGAATPFICTPDQPEFLLWYEWQSS
jgi:hypothetical protein